MKTYEIDENWKNNIDKELKQDYKYERSEFEVQNIPTNQRYETNEYNSNLMLGG